MASGGLQSIFGGAKPPVPAAPAKPAPAPIAQDAPVLSALPIGNGKQRKVSNGGYQTASGIAL